MSTPIDPDARKEVNDAIANAGSAAIGQLVDTARSSQRKREENRREKERREAEEAAAAAAAAAQAGSSVRAHPHSPQPIISDNSQTQQGGQNTST